MHTLKVDRSFVQSIEAEGGRAPFVRAIVDLAHALELAVVAEGIEEVGQIAALRRLGCRLGQGFYFSKPLRACRLRVVLCETAAGDPQRKRQPPDARFQTSSDSRIAPSWSAVTATFCSG